jgi:predicted ATPase
LTHGALLHYFRREAQTTHERVEELMTLAHEQGFPFWLAVGLMWQGWVRTEQGQGEEGITRLHQGLTATRATGAKQGGPHAAALLAEAYGRVGRVAEGLTAVAEGLTTADKSGERYWEAELYRLKGELKLQQRNVQGLESRGKEAEECFHKAIEIARKQQARSLELRAGMSLARLWQQQDKKAEAYRLLSAIYGWFTEGFDTRDLREAKALIEELNH